jgi:hypothetical protein
MIIHLEVPFDQVGHPWTRPQGSFITQTFRTLQEQFDQVSFVGLIQTGQASRSTRSPQSHVATLLGFLPPPADCLVAHLKPTTDLTIVEVLVEKLHRLEAALLQRLEVAPDTSRIAHAALDAAGLE